MTDLVCWASNIATMSRRSTAPSNIVPLECEHLPWDVSSSDVERGAWCVVCPPADRRDVLGPVHEGLAFAQSWSDVVWKTSNVWGETSLNSGQGPLDAWQGSLSHPASRAIPLGDHDALSIAEGSQRRLRRGPDVRSFRHLGWRLQLT